MTQVSTVKPSLDSSLPCDCAIAPTSRSGWEAGVVAGQNFGDDDELDIAEPLLRLVLELTDRVHLIGGTIFPTHAIHDALRDDVQIFREGVEQGAQIRVDRTHYKQDTWINWRVRESEEAEEFEVGHVSQLRLCGFRLDGQLFWSHVGGQKNDTSRVEDNFKLLGGGSYGITLGQWVPQVRAGVYYLYGSDDTRDTDLVTGSGIEGRLTVDIAPHDDFVVRLFASHFDGEDIVPRRGDPLYAFDNYTQVGSQILYEHPSGALLELGGLGQWSEGTFNTTYFLNIAWGRGFELWRHDVPAAAEES